jgi:threonylcarbamoyladenosine tRNA methylthiotransferase MtaB
MPHCAIGVDVIVGFPGEGEPEFSETSTFLESLDISYLHVFTYSERPNTAALELGPVVPVPTRNERNKALRQLSFFKQRQFHDRHLGQTRSVLFEKQDQGGMMEGWTDNYIRVTTPFDTSLVNRVVDWTLR